MWIVALLAGLLVSLPVAMAIGPVAVPPTVVAEVVGHHLVGWPDSQDWTAVQDAIVWQIRMPRVLLGVVVGAGLAVAGTALQAMVRNILADPYILGITSGASTGAAASILFGIGASLGASTLTGSAFVGAAAASIVVFALARSRGQVTSTRLLLAGVSVGYVLSATTSFLIFASDDQEGARAVLFWLLGSLSFARWSELFLAAAVVVFSTATFILWGRRFDAVAIGDATARALGVHPDRFRVKALVVVSLCIGGVVSVSGGIGFVGLIVPHVARLCVGGVHRRVVPVAALLGALFLVWADVAARVVFSPRELPLGIVTAVLGTPFLFVLVRRYQAAAPT